MTGYTVHTGSNDKFRDGWDNIFKAKKTAKAAKAAEPEKKSTGKDAGKKKLNKPR